MEPLAYSINEAAELGVARRAKLFKDIRLGKLRAIKVGRSTRILVSDFQAYVAAMPNIAPKSPAAQPDPAAQERGRLRQERARERKLKKAPKPQRIGLRRQRRD
jgi:excisionase family DNA binding protein